MRKIRSTQKLWVMGGCGLREAWVKRDLTVEPFILLFLGYLRHVTVVLLD